MGSSRSPIDYCHLFRLLAVALLTVGCPVLAVQPTMQNVSTSDPHVIQLTVSHNPKPLIHLEARQAPLAQILKNIADKTGAQIHYSVLPDEPVTATCAGLNVEQIMDCLTAKQIGLVAHKAQNGKPAEFWLLGSSVGSCPAVTVTQPILPINTEQILTYEQQAAIDQGNQDQSDALLQKFKSSKDKAERAEALNNLVAVGKIDDPDVRNALDDALMDKDDSIRAQAVETLANLDKDNSTDFLNKALQDKSAEVRMAALGKAINQPELLERALTDADNSVRQYAHSLLAGLKNSGQ
jgi:hypothetical protein